MIVGNVLETLLLALQGCRDVVGNEQNKNFIKSLSSGLQSLHIVHILGRKAIFRLFFSSSNVIEHRHFYEGACIFMSI